jgi:hypothetical protein
LDSASPEAIKKLSSANPAETFKLVAESVGNLVESWRIWSAPELAMREHLLKKLRDGQLEACGVQSAPKQMRELEVLPRHFFIDAKINWDGNKVTNLGVTYGIVQVRRRSSVTSQASTQKTLNVTADASRSALAKPSGRETGNVNTTSADTHTRALTPPMDRESTEEQRRKPGPLLGEAAVIAAYKQLLQRENLREGITRKEIYKKLLPDLRLHSTIFPNGRGLAYSSIARHLRPLLRSKFSS